MNAPSDVYRCPWCAALILADGTEWCTCATSQPTLVCGNCKRCFCHASAQWTQAFWQHASPEIAARRWLVARKPAPPPAGTGVAERPVILVIDDAKVIHVIVKAILDGYPGTILHAYDGAEGLRMARTALPDIVLTDALLPSLDGRDLARMLKNDPATAQIRTVVMTALYKGSRYRSEAFREFKVDAYIEKPVTAAELRAVVDELLDTSAPREHSIAS